MSEDMGNLRRQDVSTPYSPYDPSHQQPGMSYPPGSYAPQGGYAPGGPRGYLQGGPVSFGEAISQAFRNTFTYQGRASRSAYWWFALGMVIAGIVLVILASVLKTFGVFIDVIAYIALTLTGLSLTIRRLHDTDRSGFWWFIGLVPFVGGIVLLVFTLLEGTPGPNRFG
jgi:uncharacterized membrane protein YhaH (DUF805 family)